MTKLCNIYQNKPFCVIHKFEEEYPVFGVQKNALKEYK